MLQNLLLFLKHFYLFEKRIVLRFWVKNGQTRVKTFGSFSGVYFSKISPYDGDLCQQTKNRKCP